MFCAICQNRPVDIGYFCFSCFILTADERAQVRTSMPRVTNDDARDAINAARD